MIQLGSKLLSVPFGDLHLLVDLSAVGRRTTFLGGDLFVRGRLVVVGRSGVGSREIVDESLGDEDLDVEDEARGTVVSELEEG